MGIIRKTFVPNTSHIATSIIMKLLVIFALVCVGLSSVSVSAAKIDVSAPQEGEFALETTLDDKGICHGQHCHDPHYGANWCCHGHHLCFYNGPRHRKCKVA